MKNYLIIVEGAHDIAVVEKLLKLNGINKRITSVEKLPKVWKRTIPSIFPFTDGKLDRITPIPSFVMNENVSVAIKNAGSDTEIMPVLQQMLDTMSYEEKDHLDAIMLLFDADEDTADKKRRKMLASYIEKDDFIIEEHNKDILLDLDVKKVPTYIYIFPNNEEEGNLENLLLEAAEEVYPELLDLASDYVKQASEFQVILKKPQFEKKAKIGCIVNTMKPGKANQVSILDDEWISEKTLQVCKMLQSFWVLPRSIWHSEIISCNAERNDRRRRYCTRGY